MTALPLNSLRTQPTSHLGLSIRGAKPGPITACEDYTV